MKQFILSSEPERNGAIRLTGSDYHYLVRVRRLAAGECFPALLQSGGPVLIRVDSVDGGALHGTVVPGTAAAAEELPPPAGGPPRIVLFQALPKGEKMDLIVRQAAEAGIGEIIPFVSEFSLPRLKTRGKPPQQGSAAHSSLAKAARWQRIVREARQQSGSPVATRLCEPMPFSGLIDRWGDIKSQYPGALGLLLHQIPLEQDSLHGYLDIIPELVAVAIGPEGGFSPSEVAAFLEAGFKPLTIGVNVLRTETAAVYAAAAIQIILWERNSWEKSRK